MPSKNYWMLVSSAENFEISRRRGFDVAGMKSRHEKKAMEVKPGDKVIFYLTKVMAFGATAEVTSTYRVEKSTIWPCSSRKGEIYPFRFDIEIEDACPEGGYAPVLDLHKKMEYLKKWPAEHWRLAFQGNVHRLPRQDYLLIKKAVDAGSRRAARTAG